ncbi:hypothetical protein D9615_005105 [Tricholomella constricta]|uniref:Spc7 kinetochore protein domain-containing protein n=1 Tax=Tricholomella constricta TaxID=117010 RepID=A0A8H5M1P3_9AGAR|nr:hypothetical protein D9615_005105 [Tricholomella constricta]
MIVRSPPQVDHSLPPRLTSSSMAVSKDSPKRRKSIAAPNQNKPAVLPRAKRRPHSIVSGDRLSPFAKARRSLAPRKSILKAFTNILHNGDENPESQPQSQAESSSQPPNLSHSPDDPSVTHSMDITKDFTTKIHDNTTRKSFGGRRVSFAENVRVRLIEGINKKADGTESPQSSPIADSPPAPPTYPPTDENDYPGAASGSRRRSSARYSIAYSEDMDLTSIGPQGFLVVGDSAIADEEFVDDDAMDMTEVIHGDLIRQRSLSMGTRPPLAQLHHPDQDHSRSNGLDQSQSSEESESQVLSDADSDRSTPMDFTMPLSRSKRPPVEHDALWHALRQATHSGDTPIEREPSSDDFDHGSVPPVDDEMDLDDAVQRLMRVRQSLSSIPVMRAEDINGGINGHREPQDDTFSTEGSFEDQENYTMNLSAVFGRASLGGADIGRVSLGSTMDESEVYGAIAVPSQSTPRHSIARPEQRQTNPGQDHGPAFTVFQPPPASESHPLSTTTTEPPPQRPVVTFLAPRGPTSPSKTISSTSAPSSPSIAKLPQARTGFSAAFAPPVARSILNKRPRPSTDEGRSAVDADRPSPAKRAAIAGKWPADSHNVVSPAAPSPKLKPKPLSPSKKAPFQAPAVTTSSQQPSSSLRRPSGYFAKRKSLGGTLVSQPQKDDAPVAAKSSPKKNAALGFGRASLGSGAADAWQHFDKDAGSGIEKGKEKVALLCDRETARQTAAALAITRGSPAPASPQPAPLAVETPASLSPVVDISTLLGPAGDEDEENLDVDPTEQWRNAVEPSEFAEKDDPPISIKQFFAMTGIRFMDELTAPRRSTHPSQQNALQPRDVREVPLAEYVTAMGMDVPQLVLYSRVSKDLEAWIEKSKADFEQAEDEAAKITPELFTEYSRADEEGQAELLHQLQLIRTNTRALAKSDWYDWKLQWLEGLRTTADQTFKSLEADAKALESMRASADEIIPALKQEYDKIMQELEKETAEVAEIEACDQEYLNELKASIAEQNIEVEALQAEVAESKVKLQSLKERLEETDAQKQEAKIAIDDAQRVPHIQKNGTRAEVFRLKDELDSLEDLHMFRVTKVNAEMFEYVYGSKFRVTIPCTNFVPIVKQLDVTRVDEARAQIKDSFPRLSEFLLQMAREQIVRGENRTTRQIIHRLGDYWSSCAQLRAQLKLLTIKFPIEIEVVKGSREQPPSFKVKVMVLFPSVKAKAFIWFLFGANTLCYWPVAIRSLGCEVEVIYGNVDRDIIANAVADRLSQASPEDNYACLLDACIEGQEIYH